MTLVLAVGCAPAETKETDLPYRAIASVIAEHAPTFLALPQVTTVFEGASEEGEPCIKIGAIDNSAELREKIPETLEGYPVLIVETGELGPR